MNHQRVGFHLTDRCQLDCQHCLRDPGQKPTDLPVALIARVLDQATRHYNIRSVSLSGGEPTLHPEFGAAIDAIVDRECQWDMVTNGRRFADVLATLDERRARMLALRSLTLSLDGMDEATHDAIRGAGSFRDVMRAATLCAAREIRFGIQMTVTARNVAQIESTGLMAAQLGAAHVSFAMMQPTGTHRDAGLFLPARAWFGVRDRLARLAELLKISVVMPEGYPNDQPFAQCGPFRGETLHVDVHGRLTLCCLHADTPGDGRRDDVGGDLADVTLIRAHSRLVDIIRDAQQDRLAALESTPRGEWDDFPCNRCLRMFGRPHWSSDGATGPAARRERWRGVWEPSRGDSGSRGRLRVIS